MGEYNKVTYNNSFNAEHYDRFSLMLPKGMKEQLKADAKAAGMSVNAYILQAVQAYQSSQSK